MTGKRGRPRKQPVDVLAPRACTSCGVEQPADHFALRTGRPGMRWTYCRTCQAQRAKARYAALRGVDTHQPDPDTHQVTHQVAP